MKELFRRIFLEHWQRKILSLFIAVIVWLLVNLSMIDTKIFEHLPIKVINIPAGKTVEELQSNNFLEAGISLAIMGKKNVLNELSNKDLQVILDASNQGDEWIVSISKENLRSLNPDIDISSIVRKVSHQPFILHLIPLVTAQIPLFFTLEGNAPQGYEVVGIWPNQLSIPISASEKTIRLLQKRGITLTFDLNKISEQDLRMFKKDGESEVVSFMVPRQWKYVNISQLSGDLIAIDNPKLEMLRIDFVQKERFSLPSPLPIHVFSSFSAPASYVIERNSHAEEKNGLFFFATPLSLRGVSNLFFNIIKDHLVFIIFPSNEGYSWAIEPVGPEELAKKYVLEERKLHPQNSYPEEFLIDQFYNYLHSMRFVLNNGELLQLKIERKGQTIMITNKTHSKNE